MSTQAIAAVQNATQNSLAKSEIYILRSWDGGPLRQFSNVKRSPSWLSYEHRGDHRRRFAGRYVCDLCQTPVNGVYEPNYRVEAWCCRCCRSGLTTPDEALR